MFPAAAPPVAPRSSEESRKRKLRELEERKRVLDEKSRRVNELAALAEEMSAESTTASGGQGSAAGGPAASPSPTDAVAELFADRLEKTLERGQRVRTLFAVLHCVEQTTLSFFSVLFSPRAVEDVMRVDGLWGGAFFLPFFFSFGVSSLLLLFLFLCVSLH